jgi:hypothetical protein
MKILIALAAVAALSTIALASSNSTPTQRDLQVPHYDHIFVIVEENKDRIQIVGDTQDAPTINRLAHTYGISDHYYAVTHPSEPNYVAIVGGYTYGIRDDDAFYCAPNDDRPSCRNSHLPGYPAHTIDAPNLSTQLEAAHLTWKNYNESLPTPGSLAVTAPDTSAAGAPGGIAVYASKHSGFINFHNVQTDPKRAEHLVAFDQLAADLKSGDIPNFSFIIPNLCNDMHGAGAPGTPDDCESRNLPALIQRGDRNLNRIVTQIMNSSAWSASSNTAIVITFDEDGSHGTDGCCGTNTSDVANTGGGRIATIVMTNHGPRGVVDSTPYSHYSLLRTIEDAFGIHEYLRQAADPSVQAMLPLFAR